MRIVFCIPGRRFSGSFLNSWTYLLRQIGPNIEWYMVNGYVPNVSYSRQALLDRAKMLRPTHYMWIDDDQVFTYEQFEKLLDRDLNIISGIYKKSPELFACCKLNGETLTIRDEMFEGKYIRTPLGGFYNHSKDSNIMKMVSDVIPKFNFGDVIDPNKKIEPLKDGKNNRENLYFNLKEKPEAKYMFLISTKDIEPGEELVANYTLYTFS